MAVVPASSNAPTASPVVKRLHSILSCCSFLRSVLTYPPRLCIVNPVQRAEVAQENVKITTCLLLAGRLVSSRPLLLRRHPGRNPASHGAPFIRFWNKPPLLMAINPHSISPPARGEYKKYTWREVRDVVQWTAVGLRTIGAAKGSMIALQSETRAEFYFADLGVMAAGAVAAALYTSVPFADQAKAIQFCDCKIALVENAKAYQGLVTALGDAAREIRWILLTGEVGEVGPTEHSVMTLAELWDAGKRKLAEDPAAFERIRAEYTAADVAVVYDIGCDRRTENGTGEPSRAGHEFDMVPPVLPLSPADSTIAFLPSAHMAQRMVGELLPVFSGTAVWFSEGLSKLPNRSARFAPLYSLAPPRLWERIYASIIAEIKKKPAAVQKMFYLGLGLGNKAATLKREGKPMPWRVRLPLALADKIMFSKIRQRLGGQ